MIIEPKILDLLERYGMKPWEGNAWRFVFGDRDPLAPSWAGGRWSLSKEFATLYTSLSPDGAIAEAKNLISRYSIPPSKVRKLYQLSGHLSKVIDLTVDNRLNDLGVDLRDLDASIPLCAEIGAAANFLSCQGLIVPNVRHSTKNLVIYSENFGNDCQLSPLGHEQVVLG